MSTSAPALTDSSSSSLLFQGFYASALSTFHMLYIVVLGILSKKLKIVDTNFQKALSKVVTNVVLPCFIFSQILKNFSIERYELLFESMLGCFFLFIFGWIMGYIIAKFLSLSPGKSSFMAAVFSTPHTTSIPVILIQIVGPVLDQIIPAQAGLLGNSQQRGFLYIVMNSIYSNIWRWSGAYYLIDPEEYEDPRDAEALLSKDPWDENKPKKPKNTGFSFSKFFSSIVNAPLIASIFSIALVLSPTIQNYFTAPHSLWNESLISVNTMVSKAYPFIVMYILGLSFSDSITFGSESISEEQKKINERENFLTSCDLFWLSIMKLIVMPLLACPLIVYIFGYWLQTDSVLIFIYLFMASAPSAINIIVICTYKDCYVGAVSLLMVVMYAASLITLTLQVTFFIYLLGELNLPVKAI